MSSTLCRFCQQEILMARTGPGEFDFVPLDPHATTEVYVLDSTTGKGLRAAVGVLADHRRTCEVLRSAEFKYLNDETRGRLLAMVMSVPDGGQDVVAADGTVTTVVPAPTQEPFCRDCPHPISNHPEVAGERFCDFPGCSCFAWRA